MPFFHVTNGLLRQPRLLSDGVFGQTAQFPLLFEKLDNFHAFGMTGFGLRHAISLLEKGLTALLHSCYHNKNPIS
jgi:hypothetical protein